MLKVKISSRWLFAIIVIIAALASNCRKEKFFTGDNASLRFSTDTVLFDTIFSTIGSTTQVLKVYNPYSRSLLIDDIKLNGGSSSNYTLNIDGKATHTQADYVLKAKDSLYIFVEVTIDPNGGYTPMVVSDEIVFTIGQNSQKVNLVAWGWDAYYHTANAFGAILFENNDTLKVWYHSVDCNSTWLNDKPHLVYGYAIVEPNCQLNIQQGAQIHFHKSSGLIVGNPFSTTAGSTLIANGTKDEPIVFQGDRLDMDYKEIPGQWDRIWFTGNSQSNTMDYCIVRNGNIGIQVDTMQGSNPSLNLNHSTIHNHSGLGILGRGAWIKASNTLIYNCGQYAAALVYGGKYEFVHCSIGNYWSYTNRTTPSLILNNFYEDNSGAIVNRDLIQADFINCIVSGNVEEEIELQNDASGGFDYSFDHCILKTKINTTSADYVSCIVNPTITDANGNRINAIFSDVDQDDYSLFQESVAIDKGTTSSVLDDISGEPRTNTPDIGAYEYVP